MEGNKMKWGVVREGGRGGGGGEEGGMGEREWGGCWVRGGRGREGGMGGRRRDVGVRRKRRWRAREGERK